MSKMKHFPHPRRLMDDPYTQKCFGHEKRGKTISNQNLCINI